MKAGIIITGTGPILIWTTYDSFDDPKLVEKLKTKGITKYIALMISWFRMVKCTNQRQLGDSHDQAHI